MTTNDLTPAGNIQSASAFHAISWVEVTIDTNPQMREVYKQGSSGYGDDRVDYYALSNVALSRLMNAAGIEETSSHRTDTREHPHICAWQFGARYVQPDSTVLSYSADYELDLRDYIHVNGETYRGARFEKALVDEREALIYYENEKTLGKVYGDKRTKAVDALYGSMADEQKKRFDDMSEAKALRYVVQMRQFIVQRAQTGAMERAIRKMLNLKSAYTLAELKNPFRVPRSRFDWDRLDAAIGKNAGQELRQLEAMKVLGIDVSTYQQFKQLNSPPPQSVPEGNVSAWAGDVSTPPEQTVDVEKSVDMPAPPAEVIPEGSVNFRGMIVKLDDVVGIALTEEPEKTWFKTTIFEQLKPRKHYESHLLAHFGKSSASNLTWAELIAMSDKFSLGVEYPAKYNPTPTTKASSGDLDARIKASGLFPILSEMKLDSNDPNVVRVIEDMIKAVTAGSFDPHTPDGQAEIRTFLAQEIK